MTTSSSRRKRRAIRALGKKTAGKLAKDNGVDVRAEVSQDPAVLGVKVAALERALQQLISAQKQNHLSLIQAFNLTDAHLWVLKQLCKDIVAETVMVVDGPTKTVNMEAYYDLFNAHMKQQAEAAAAAKKAAKTAPKQQDEDAEVFGGNVTNVEDPERNTGAEGREGVGEVGVGAGAQEAPVPAL